MNKKLIREWLINKKPRVYTVIVKTYYKELESLQTSLFKDWLAKELEIEIDYINHHSINSALSRFRKKVNTKEFYQEHTDTREKPGTSEINPFNTEIPSKISFI